MLLIYMRIYTPLNYINIFEFRILLQIMITILNKLCLLFCR